MVSPIPPPVHGAAVVVENLLGEKSLRWRHLNARFSQQGTDFQAFSVRKVLLLARYLIEIVIARTLGRCATVILTPTFLPKPFLKDALLIWWCWLLRFRIVAWYHMNFPTMRIETQPVWYRCLATHTLRRCGFHVCVSPRLLSDLPAFIPPHRRYVIANGIEPVSHASPEELWRFRRDAAPKVVFISNLAEQKGWRVLLAAAREICTRNSDVSFDFFGAATADNSERDIVSAFAATGHPRRIRYGGPLDQSGRAEALRTATLFCMPSLNEALPLVVLEAMSAALPVVASEIGGIPDALTPEGGILVPPGDRDALVAQLSRLLSDLPLCESMGRHNRERFQQEYLVTIFRGRWVEFLNRAEACHA